MAFMQRLKRALVWLSRIRHCRGFGIQSPTDYRFVRYVINEHDPYYLYAELERRFADLPVTQRKLGELYFRLANECQAACFVDFWPPTEAYAAYVKAGCRRTNVFIVEKASSIRLADTTCPCLVRASWHEGVETMLTQLLGESADGSIFIVEGIKEGKKQRMLWKALAQHPRVGAAYDLYYCGIIIADKRRYKKNYIINF